MKKAGLISFAVLLLIAGQAHGDMPWWLGSVDILPQNPASSDVISITLSGVWGDTCVPNDSNVSVADKNIYFDVISDYPGVMCSPICCFGWRLAESVGPLPAGTYTIYARLVHIGFPPGSYTPVAESIVTGIYYVDAADGNDNNDGLSPETAFATIQKGIDTAQDGDTVIATDAIYTGPGNRDIVFPGMGIAVTLRSKNGPENCIIDCQGAETQPHRAFLFSRDRGVPSVVDGFTITNGYFGSPYIWPESSGGAILCDWASPIITNCIIRGNSAGRGGGICCGGSRNATITNCVFTQNVAADGGGVYCQESMIDIAPNNVIITNCTFSDNVAIYGGAVRIDEGGHLSMVNCILWGDNATFGPEIAMNGFGLDWSSASIGYSNVEGGQAAIFDIGGLDWGPGNIDTDPCFADSCNGDYHLQSAAGRWDPNTKSWVYDANTSLCIDAGNPGCLPGEEPDPNGNRINMGAYGGTAEASKSPPDWALLADLTNDRKVDSNDLRVFVSYWLETGQCIPSDLDRDQLVDLPDFAIFGRQWSDTLGTEPGMTYQVGDCDRGAEDANSGEPRFSVWVVGRHIHFEDLMYANCCPDALGLEKEINGNQITLYEIGYGGMCDCMCYFPVTATLGPFDDGTYTVEVFDNYGQLLGVVQVIVGEPAEPGITYQINGCDLGASGSFVAEPSGQTWFTVTVEGSYIHFEDMMVANCCPDELGLEMTVEDNLITIQETEYSPHWCRCMCEYPISATLGPFEPGTYTLEVYEDYGGFIGSTTVVVGSGQ